ncbi:MAG: [FeFe] hydrogenase, group A [Ruminococcus sp.]|nr:[FeFe] hydrogenase, group A [Ruminococcus sp.]
MNNNFMIIDGIPVAIEGEKNLLELIRKAGIDLPTFCYYSELSVYGACRMCMVENKWGGMEAACSTPPRPGMEIKTNTPRLRKYRKMILELLLSNHCRDCTTCDKSGTCRLQELARRFDIHRVRFDNPKSEPEIDDSSLSVTRDASKCILCGDCVRMCNEVQNVGAIDFAFRGSKMKVACSFDKPLGQSNCVGCGQCAAVCPTGAIVVKDDAHKLWEKLNDPDKIAIAQVAPAVRVAVAKEFGYEGENVMGKITAALRRMGFNLVFDTSTAADLTVMEEANEFIERLENGGTLPMFTSCCPAWVKYAENEYPEYVPNISTCRSPMQMFASVIAEQYKDCGKEILSVAVMPCTAKKSEAAREEFMDENGKPYVDYVITTKELIKMIRQSGIVFSELEPEAVDLPFGTMTGSGVIFGVTGGVMEAVIRRVSSDKSITSLRNLAFEGVRGFDGIKKFEVPTDNRALKVAVVNGLGNVKEIMREIEAGERFDLIEVMACPDGCIGGAGQPTATTAEKEKRGENLYAADKLCTLKFSEENPIMKELYDGILKGKTHELLHVSYVK